MKNYLSEDIKKKLKHSIKDSTIIIWENIVDHFPNLDLKSAEIYHRVKKFNDSFIPLKNALLKENL